MKIIVSVILLCSLFGLPLASATMMAAAPRVRGRALLVGINNYKHPMAKATLGSEEDAIETREFIKQQYGFYDSEINLLLGPQATAANIVRVFREWLINDTRPGDRVFFLYSGHGTRLPDDNHDEEDGFDEALAPYDASEDLSSYIRDDHINAFIKQLAGRRVVMVFDSCFSGTISRGLRVNVDAQAEAAPKYFPSPQELTKLKEAARSTGKGSADDYIVQPGGQSRDLNLVVDNDSVGVTGVVIFSAAQANQTAFSVKIAGRYRGALSYAFNEMQRGGLPPLSELEQRIAAEIARLHRERMLKGNQEPAFEVYSDQPLVNIPLFGEMALTASPLPANPQSPVKLSISTVDGRSTYYFGTERGSLYGDLIAYRVSTDTAGYLYLIVFSQNNVATCIFPNEKDKDNWVEPGTFRLPRSSAGFYAQKPEGKDVAVALFSATQLNLGDREEYEWDDIFDRLRNQRFNDYVRTRGIGSKPPNASLPTALTNWQSASIVLEAKRRDR